MIDYIILRTAIGLIYPHIKSQSNALKSYPSALFKISSSCLSFLSWFLSQHLIMIQLNDAFLFLSCCVKSQTDMQGATSDIQAELDWKRLEDTLTWTFFVKLSFKQNQSQGSQSDHEIFNYCFVMKCQENNCQKMKNWLQSWPKNDNVSVSSGFCLQSRVTWKGKPQNVIGYK